LQILLPSTCVTMFLFGLFGISWDKIDEAISRDYPSVKFISTDELSSLQHNSDSEFPLLIDVRDPAEFRVSHLQDAINLVSARLIAERVVDKNTELVVYCSVGYRSAGVAQELETMGYTSVKNLRHSIFEWANKHYPMVNENGITTKVHPFNRTWGKLLDESLHAYPE
jgi:rhodanese-related sulfurtransferase